MHPEMFGCPSPFVASAGRWRASESSEVHDQEFNRARAPEECIPCAPSSRSQSPGRNYWARVRTPLSQTPSPDDRALISDVNINIHSPYMPLTVSGARSSAGRQLAVVRAAARAMRGGLCCGAGATRRRKCMCVTYSHQLSGSRCTGSRPDRPGNSSEQKENKKTQARVRSE